MHGFAWSDPGEGRWSFHALKLLMHAAHTATQQFCLPTASDLSDIMASTQSKPKRLSYEMRDANLSKGSFLIEFKQPAQPYDIYQESERESPFQGDKPPVVTNASKLKSLLDQYKTMERKGFKVTKDCGCLIPDDQYSTQQQGSTVKGHQRAVGFFSRFVPSADDNFGLRNEFGWPCTLQISHKCHRRKCCRIDHLIAEEQWRNLKRNYCGFGGECDCGSDIPCVRRYQPTNFAEMPEFCTTQDEVQEALADCPMEFVIRPPDYYASRDKKAKQRKENREGRKRAGSKQQHASGKKQKKQQQQQNLSPIVESSESDSD